MKAKIKSVRQFSCVSGLTPDDEAFRKWWSKNQQLRAVEIGCGSGLHPIAFAKRNPSTALLALERTKDKFKAFSSRMQNHELPNLYGVQADALEFLPNHIGENSVDHIYMLYPNPYPKESQANKRFHRSPFFHFLLHILKNDGVMTIATNENWFMEECRLYGKEFWAMKESSYTEISKESLKTTGLHLPRTHFEKKYLERGETCYNLVLQKTSESRTPQLVR